MFNQTEIKANNLAANAKGVAANVSATEIRAHELLKNTKDYVKKVSGMSPFCFFSCADIGFGCLPSPQRSPGFCKDCFVQG